MNYGYIRVSTDKQTVENQRYEINQYAETNNLIIDSWFEETISGTVAVEKRALGRLLGQMEKGDVIICSELSRLGRNMFMIMNVLNQLLSKDVMIKTVKENYNLGDDILSKVLAFSFSISAEIERSLLSQRTKESLKRLKSEGRVLGRPKGRKNNVYKLSKYDDKICTMINCGKTVAQISDELGICMATVYNYLKRQGIEPPSRRKK